MKSLLINWWMIVIFNIITLFISGWIAEKLGDWNELPAFVIWLIITVVSWALYLFLK